MTNIARKKYLKSPVIEVLCEIKFGDAVSEYDIEPFHQEIKDEYPLAENGLRIDIKPLPTEKDFSVPQLVQTKAFRFANNIKTKFIQVSGEILTFNDVTTPYKGFESFCHDLFPIIRNYKIFGKPEEIKRIELRYINQFSFNSEQGLVQSLISKYLNFVPQLDDALANFELKFQVKPHHIGHFLFVTIKQLPIKKDEEIRYILDIQNIYREHNVFEDNAIEKNINDAHENIGRVFEKFITDEARKLFEEVSDDKCSW